MRRALAILLIIVGAAWTVMSVVGVMMMSRSVDVLAEMLPPAAVGVTIVEAGTTRWRRASPLASCHRRR